MSLKPEDLSQVYEPASPKRRGLLAALLALCLVLAIAAVVVPIAVSSDEDNTYRAHGVSFEYPAGWQEITGDARSEVEAGDRDELWTAAFGIGEADVVAVTTHRLTMRVTADNLDAATEGVTSFVRRLSEQTGGTVQDGPVEITIAGMPGLRYRGEWANENGTPLESTLMFAFDGTAEYFIECRRSRERAAEIEQGCDQVLRTFELHPQPGDQVATYGSHTQVTDDQGVVTVEVPAEWDDLDGSQDPDYGPTIHAAPDLEQFHETWDAPGIIVEVSAHYGAEDISTTLEQLGPSEHCTSEGREPYERRRYSGEVERWTSCGGTDTIVRTAAVVPADGSYLIRIFGQAIDDRDLDVIDRAIDMFEISKPGAAELVSIVNDNEWLDKISDLHTQIDNAILSTDTELTSPVLNEMATAMSTCRRELASIGRPSTRLKDIHALVKKACQKYDKAAECLAAAAEIGSPTISVAENRKFDKVLDCGFASLNRGSELFVYAETRASDILLARPPPMTDIDRET
jgi:hypothetical protein